MSLQLENKSYKRKSGNYEFTITNEDSYEEVAKFKLNKLTAYLVACTLFVLGILFVTAIIVLSPLKYYLPNSGYGNANQVKELRLLKIKTDSLEKRLSQNQLYYNNLQKVLSGKIEPFKDTTKISIQTKDQQDDKKGKQRKRKKQQ